MEWVLIAAIAVVAVAALLYRLTLRVTTRRAINAMLIQHGFPADYVHGSGETRDELADRLTRQCRSGARTLSGVNTDLQWVANNQLVAH